MLIVTSPNYREAHGRLLRSGPPDAAAPGSRCPARATTSTRAACSASITGSTHYPGAAVLGVEAALRTGRRHGALPRPRARDRPRAAAPTRGGDRRRPGAGLAARLGQDHETATSECARDGARPAACRSCSTAGALDSHASRDRARRAHAARRRARAAARRRARATSRPTRRLGAARGRRARRDRAAQGAHDLRRGPGVALSVRIRARLARDGGRGDALAGILGALVATHADGSRPTRDARPARGDRRGHPRPGGRTRERGRAVHDPRPVRGAIPATIAESAVAS